MHDCLEAACNLTDCFLCLAFHCAVLFPSVYVYLLAVATPNKIRIINSSWPTKSQGVRFLLCVVTATASNIIFLKIDGMSNRKINWWPNVK